MIFKNPENNHHNLLTGVQLNVLFISESLSQKQNIENRKAQIGAKKTLNNVSTQPTCPMDCPCRKQNTKSSYIPLLFNALGIIIALFATYLLITTDSKLYLIFWICYSVLRRVMAKTKSSELKLKSD